MPFVISCSGWLCLDCGAELLPACGILWCPALRMLYGLDRFSEDLDFSLLRSDRSFSMITYADALRKEIAAFGFQVELRVLRESVADRSSLHS